MHVQMKNTCKHNGENGCLQVSHHIFGPISSCFQISGILKLAVCIDVLSLSKYNNEISIDSKYNFTYSGIHVLQDDMS